MRKTAAALFPDCSEEQERFLSSLLHPEERGSALVWTKEAREVPLQFVTPEEIPSWLPGEIALLAPGEKPGSTEQYQRGDYYPLDFSSVLTGSALLALRGESTADWKILDLCAAPGGKSILASQLLHPALLLSNEVIGKRLGILRHNLARCGLTETFTQRLSAEEWAAQTPSAFDLSLVDAPCSGQSLLAKGKDNPGCFHPSIVKGNARRQLKILRAAGETVAPGGYLFYSTCTFAIRENEGVVTKLLKSNPDFSAVEVPHLEELRSPHSEFPSYRVYPHRSRGAGGFVCLLRRRDSGQRNEISNRLLSYPVSGGD